MPDFQHLMLFIAAGWLLNLTPGPDVLYIVTHALRSGARAGVIARLGITAGWMARRGAVQRGMHWLDRVAGAMFIGFGVKLALTNFPFDQD